MNPQLVTYALLGFLLAGEPPAEGKRDPFGDPLPPGAVARLGTTRFRDKDAMIFAAISPDKKLLATTSGHNLIVWDVATGSPIQIGKPPKPWIAQTGWPDSIEWLYCLSFSPDGESLALSVIENRGQRHQLRIYDMRSGKLRQTIAVGTRGVDKLAYSRDGKWLFTILHDDYLRVWDVESGEPVKTLPDLPPRALDLVLAPDGKTLAIAAGEYSKPLVPQIHDLVSGKLITRFNQKGTGSSSLTFFPDGKAIAAIGPSGGQDGKNDGGTWELQVLDVGRGEVKQRSKPIHWNKEEVKREFSGVRGICISPDGKWIAVGNGNGRGPGEACIIVFDAATLNETARFYEPHGKYGWQHVYGLQFFDNDNLLTWGNHHSITIWDVKTGKRKLPKDGPTTPAAALAFSPDDETLIHVGPHGDSAYRMWNYATNKVVEGGEADLVSGIGRAAVSRDGKFLVAAKSDATAAHLVDLTQHQTVAKWPLSADLFLAAVSADGQLAALTNSRNSAVPLMIYDAKAGEKKYEIDLKKQGYSQVVLFSADNRRVFVGSNSGIVVHDLELGRPVATIGGEPPSKPKTATAGPPIPPRPVGDWEREQKERREQWQKFRTQGYYLKAEKIAITTDGKRLISLGTESIESELRIWETATGRQCRLTPWQGPYYTKAMDLAENNRWFAVAKRLSDEDGAVSILDLYTGRELHTFKGHLGPVSQIAFSHNVKLLATAGDDTTTLVWDLAAIARQPAPPAKPLTEEELSESWALLSGQDAGAAFEALARLIDDPARCVPFAKKKLAKAQPFPDEAIEKLIANLDSDDFNVREEASKNLAKLGCTAEPAMQKELAKTSSAEVKARLRRLLAALPEEKFDAITVFAARVTELLERVGTPEAQDLLTELAKGPPSARLTQEAGDSVKRLEKKPTSRR
jgi:WD40 repeat protein